MLRLSSHISPLSRHSLEPRACSRDFNKILRFAYSRCQSYLHAAFCHCRTDVSTSSGGASTTTSGDSSGDAATGYGNVSPLLVKDSDGLNVGTGLGLTLATNTDGSVYASPAPGAGATATSGASSLFT